MFLAAKYARKKLKERQQRNDKATTELERLSEPHASSDAKQVTSHWYPPPTTPQTNSSGQGQPSHGQTAVLPIEPHDSAKPLSPLHDEKETTQGRAETKRRRAYRYRVIFGLFMPFTLQALDTTIIASALPFIAEDFGTFSFTGQASHRGMEC